MDEINGRRITLYAKRRDASLWELARLAAEARSESLSTFVAIAISERIARDTEPIATDPKTQIDATRRRLLATLSSIESAAATAKGFVERFVALSGVA